MYYPADHPGFAAVAKALEGLTQLFDQLLPKLYGAEWPATAIVLSTSIMPFLKVALASANATNVPVLTMSAGPGVGKTTFLELICALLGRPESSIMQGEDNIWLGSR